MHGAVDDDLRAEAKDSRFPGLNMSRCLGDTLGARCPGGYCSIDDD